MDTVRVTVKLPCRRCGETGMIRGMPQRMEGGYYIRPERDCEHCQGIGHRIETVELGYDALVVLAEALRTIG
jgi:hypothetical protein